MENYNFIASDNFDLADFNELDKFVDSFPDFQTVSLNNDNELEKLLELMKISNYSELEIPASEFQRYWDISTSKLPEFNETEFDEFYELWLTKSERMNNMDEYGQLIFLQRLSLDWNTRKYRMIVKEIKST
ncbi:hypothetical protein [Flavivirga spongiicola]|uniref:Uncharacterized protein n=1 Tax=Flavivirga spongiicola TaxID=421621 RepID=A0ABU7XQB7_9FLAO|nr:hypothetical protein [Flavivirga sp. MEBiC05379]MDO5981753.1 hypothetical protein [Flavivirga sp. MEBiC05379]